MLYWIDALKHLCLEKMPSCEYFIHFHIYSMHCSNAKIKTTKFWFPDRKMSFSDSVLFWLACNFSAFQPPLCKPAAASRLNGSERSISNTAMQNWSHPPNTHLPRELAQVGGLWAMTPPCCWVRGRKGNSDSHSVLLNYLALRAGNSSQVSATKKFLAGGGKVCRRGAAEPSQWCTPATQKARVCSDLDWKVVKK